MPVWCWHKDRPIDQWGASLLAQLVKKLPAMRETWVRSLGWEDPRETGKATHYSILAWRIPWTIVHGVTPWTIVHGVTKSWTRWNKFYYIYTYIKKTYLAIYICWAVDQLFSFWSNWKPRSSKFHLVNSVETKTTAQAECMFSYHSHTPHPHLASKICMLSSKP